MDQELDRVDVDPLLDIPTALCRIAARERKPILPAPP
jgi:hypothetical protein